jgi:hypothetical protein
LSFQAQLSEEYGGLNGSTAYICGGEGLFPIRRLSQMAKHYESALDCSSEAILSRIHIEQCYNVEDVLDTLVGTF